MEHGNIVEFLNSGTNRSHLAFRCRTIQKVARAIDWIHSKGFVHADIKGANVLVDADGNPRLADFGISRIVHEEIAETEADLTRVPRDSLSEDTGYANDASVNSSAKHSSLGVGRKIPGSIRWMAPESFESREPTKKRDVYAFAYLVLQIFQNKKPFAQSPDKDVTSCHLVCSRDASRALNTGEEAESLKEYRQSLGSTPLWDIVLRCMRFEAALRPDAMDVKKDMLMLCRSLERPTSSGK
ncbi:kinase-like domain-containing protein [Mycena polygramma]|nr:kinase-like domain-containing protein [Mycena polygramma]